MVRCDLQVVVMQVISFNRGLSGLNLVNTCGRCEGKYETSNAISGGRA